MSDIQTVSFSDNNKNQVSSGINFLAQSTKKQLELIPDLFNGEADNWEILREFFSQNQSQSPDPVTGKIYQYLRKAETPEAEALLSKYFSTGIISLDSERNVDYTQLQELLVKGEFQAADSLTRQKFCELAGESALQRKWVYFTEVQQFPATDLQTINQLWWLFSEGKFGFGVQRQIWLSVGQDFVKLWPKIGWKSGNEWTRYPNGFTWNLSAPKGHLPLINQLRGVRVIASLFNHPVWQQK